MSAVGEKTMSAKKVLLQKRLFKLRKHWDAFEAYYRLIIEMLETENLLTAEKFSRLEPRDQALFDAYIKRFASIQDYMGAKIFPLLVEMSGIGVSKMSEVLYLMEREEVIDSVATWIELREVRNALEHDYPDELAEALEDLKYCIDSFGRIECYVEAVDRFAKRLPDASI